MPRREPARRWASAARPSSSDASPSRPCRQRSAASHCAASASSRGDPRWCRSRLRCRRSNRRSASSRRSARRNALAWWAVARARTVSRQRSPGGPGVQCSTRWASSARWAASSGSPPMRRRLSSSSSSASARERKLRRLSASSMRARRPSRSRARSFFKSWRASDRPRRTSRALASGSRASSSSSPKWRGSTSCCGKPHRGTRAAAAAAAARGAESRNGISPRRAGSAC